MHLSSRFCLLVTVSSVLGFFNSVLQFSLGFILMYCDSSLRIITQIGDFGFRSSLGNVLLFFLAFGAGLRVLQCGVLKWFIRELIGKSRVLRDDLRSKRVLWKEERFKESSKGKANGDHCLEERDDDVDLDEFHVAKEDFEEEEMDNENEVFSVTALREMVKDERRKAYAALRDLEKERMAAASAAEEAMAMIFRLQNEKSSLQIEANQLHRAVEEKQAYDQDVIQSLQWALMQYEEERSVMEAELELCKNRLKVYEHGDESENFESFSSPCTPCLSQPHLASCKLEDLRIGSIDEVFVNTKLGPN